MKVVAWLACASALLTMSAVTAAPPHPLDPLSWEEHWDALLILQQAGKIDAATRFTRVALAEPDKAEVWAWHPGNAVKRAAFAVIKQGPTTYEATVDLASRRVTQFNEVKDVQPRFLDEEFKDAISDVVKGNPEVIAALAKRGIKDLTFVRCGGGAPGYFGIPEEEGRRIAYATCDLPARVRNAYTRQIENLTIVVDVNEKKVLRVVDEGVVSIAATDADFDRSHVGPLRRDRTRLEVSQPDGPSFTLDGHRVNWRRWSFHVSLDHRVGLVISTATFQDHDRARPVLYQGHLSEIFVPYMDPSLSWRARNFLDAGEYSAGGLPDTLQPGTDCPANAAYLDMIIADDKGLPQDRGNTGCLFERYAGDVAWRHGSASIPAGRPQRELVARFMARIGNYDYVFDWVFQDDGTLRIAIGATGIVEVKTVAEADARTKPVGATRPDAYGRFVDRNLVAINHDHYFCFRLDVDVDGVKNSFVRDALKSVALPADNPRRSIWVVDPTTARTERDAQIGDDGHAGLWRVVNPARSNSVGYPVGYQLRPSMTIHTLLSPDDYPRRRAGFIEHDLWVTPYRKDERYAAGDYPTLSKPGQGLPRWTAADRVIENTDVVLWYTFGMHHVVRAEDWPVMPVLWHSFELRPFDFFDRNPSLDSPSAP